MIEILSSIIFLGFFVYGIYFLIKKRINNKKETGSYFSFSFKKNPFLYVGLPFFILTIISFLIAGVDTMFSTISLLITYSIFLIWLLIYTPIKFFFNVKNRKNKKKKDRDSWFLIICKFLTYIFIIFILAYGVAVLLVFFSLW